MEVHQIVKELDEEIARLKQARALLAGEARGIRKRGRPPKSAAKAAKKPRRLSAAGRRRISEALRRRWAQHRKAKAKTEKSAKAT